MSWLANGLATVALSQEDVVTLTPREKWTTVFGGSNIERNVEVRAAQPFEGILTWSYWANGRTLDRGDRKLTLAKRQAQGIAIPLRVPAVNADTIFATQLTVAIFESGVQAPLATAICPLTIFPRDPFHGRTEWLKGLSIALYDPVDKTADLLESAAVPFRRMRDLANLEKLEAPETRLLIVGEGNSYRANSRLAEVLSSLAARGVPVLCLAPGDGQLPPDENDDHARPSGLQFRQGDVILEFDKRLDANEWMSSADIAATRLQLRATRNRVVFEVSHDVDGWPWLRLDYGNGSSLVVCGFGIIRRWNDGPTPRFLLARLIESLAGDSRPSVDTSTKGTSP